MNNKTLISSLQSTTAVSLSSKYQTTPRNNIVQRKTRRSYVQSITAEQLHCKLQRQ